MPTKNLTYCHLHKKNVHPAARFNWLMLIYEIVACTNNVFFLTGVIERYGTGPAIVLFLKSVRRMTFHLHKSLTFALRHSTYAILPLRYVVNRCYSQCFKSCIVL